MIETDAYRLLRAHFLATPIREPRNARKHGGPVKAYTQAILSTIDATLTKAGFEVHSEVALRVPGRLIGRLDFFAIRGDEATAIEVDSFGYLGTRSQGKLAYCTALGHDAIWIRWGGIQLPEYAEEAPAGTKRLFVTTPTHYPSWSGHPNSKPYVDKPGRGVAVPRIPTH